MDTRLQLYANRLAAEWASHGKIIIGVDFDSTISPYHTLDNPDDIKRTITLLGDCQRVGCFTVIHTACRPDRHDEILRYCASIGLKVDTINETPIDMEYGQKGSKPYCNHFLDDRAALPAALDILEQAMVEQRTRKYWSVHRDDIA